MEYIQQIADKIATDLTKPKRYNYSEESLVKYIEDGGQCESFKIDNRRGEKLECILIKGKLSNDEHKLCVIFAHGLGSNKLEMLPILKLFEEPPYDFLAFDFSGSGQSEGSYTTYGLREQDDVLAVLSYLDTRKNYENYVLWGRSMGAVSLVLSQIQHANPKVSALILDSPFASFEKIAIEIAAKRLSFPNFLLKILLNPLKSAFEKQPCNPFEIVLQKSIELISQNIIFIYSHNDTVVSSEHSRELISKCKVQPRQIEIQQDHNAPRSEETISKIIDFIQFCVKQRRRRRSASRTRGIRLTSRERNESMDSERGRKISMSFQQENRHEVAKLRRTASPFNSIKPEEERNLSCRANQIPLRSKIIETLQQESSQKASKFSLVMMGHNKLNIPINSVCLHKEQKDTFYHGKSHRRLFKNPKIIR